MGIKGAMLQTILYHDGDLVAQTRIPSLAIRWPFPSDAVAATGCQRLDSCTYIFTWNTE